MTKEQVRVLIEETGIIPAVRFHSQDDALFAAMTVFRSGIPLIEITMTTPGALDAIAKLSTEFPDCVIGAGTVIETENAGSAVAAGASFLTSPGFDPGTAAYAAEGNIMYIPGALTPSEIMAAMRTSPEFIKIFPCAAVGGPPYIRALSGPFPSCRLIASGGVTQRTAAEYIRAGATVLGIGEELVPHQAVRLRNATWIGELARRFTTIVKETRAMFTV